MSQRIQKEDGKSNQRVCQAYNIIFYFDMIMIIINQNIIMDDALFCYGMPHIFIITIVLLRAILNYIPETFYEN